MFRVFNFVLMVISAALLFSGCADSNEPQPGDTILGSPTRMGNGDFINPDDYDPNAQYGAPSSDNIGSGGSGYNPGDLEVRDMGSFNSTGPGGMGGMGGSDDVLSSIYFGFDSSSVPGDERYKLEAAADYLRNNPGARLIAEGHTDSIGTSEYNNALSDRRAQSVKEYLETLGIMSNRVEILALGEIEADQSATKGSEASRLDRRVDLVPVQ
ncbi:MAG: OmpA family protein [Puniceicoccales bacterium]